MNTERTEPGRRDGTRATRNQRPRSGPAHKSKRPPQAGATGGASREAFGGAVAGKVSRPVSMLPSEADGDGPEPGALRPLARALIELAVALRRDAEKGARQ